MHTVGRMGLEACGACPPKLGDCEAVPGVSCGLLRVVGVWGGGVGWPSACVVGW